MAISTAGVLLYKFTNNNLEVFLVHPGGPFWARKDDGAWSVPKGELSEGEDKLTAARREFEEETGTAVDGNFLELKPVKSSSKMIYTFALAHDMDASTVTSNLFSMEWPPKSGRIKEFPEVDRGEWFSYETALIKINKYQVPILKELFGKFFTKP